MTSLARTQSLGQMCATLILLFLDLLKRAWMKMHVNGPLVHTCIRPPSRLLCLGLGGPAPAPWMHVLFQPP